MNRFAVALFALMLAIVAPALAAVDEDDLLPIEQAFALDARVDDAGHAHKAMLPSLDNEIT